MQEFTVATIFLRIRAGWYTPAAFAVIIALFSMATLIGSKPVYRVTMSVIPAPSDQGGQTMQPNGTLSSLLGLASGGNVNYARYQRLLSSPAVAQRLQDKYGMLQYVFRSYWDAKRKVWVPHYSTRDYLVGWLLRLANVPTWSPPDITTLALYLKSQLTLLPMENSDIVTITMDSPDVEFAKRVMLEAHQEANLLLRDQIAHRARLQVAYLENKLAQTSVEDYRATLLTMLANQQKTLMFAQTDAAFAAEIVSPPTASGTPVAPRPVLTVFVGALVGFLSGLAVVIFFGPFWWRNLLGRLRGYRSQTIRTEPRPATRT